MKNIAINGFGRIGRLAFRKLFDHQEVNIVAINDLTDPKTLAYLLQYDSAQGLWKKGEVTYEEDAIIVAGHKILVCAERDPRNLPWKKHNIDVVVESTGLFTQKEKAALHLEAGAKKVLISAPTKSAGVKTIVYGVNHETLDANDTIISGASCTTNCLVPMVAVLDEVFGLEKAFMTTIHAATNDQRVLDLPHKDLRRGRSVLGNIIPTSTGAAIAVGLVLPHLNHKLDGIAMRIQSKSGSIVDLTAHLKTKTTAEEINSKMKQASETNLHGVLEYNTEPIVSCDTIGSSYGSIFDATLTKVMEVDGAQIVKVYAWYDNESSYASQMVRTLLHFMHL